MLSVVMSVYNGARYLPQAVQSVLDQTYRDFEFLIVDDGSTDASAQILADYAGRDPRIRILSQANAGLPAALNRAIAQAGGTFIARMDADDIALPHRFQTQMDVIGAKGIDLLGSGYLKIDQDGTVTGKRLLPTKPSEILRTLPYKNCLCHPTVIFSKAMFDQVGGYDEAFRNCQDYDLWLRFAGRAKIANLGTALVQCRRHDDRISAKANTDRQTRYSVAAALNHFARLSGLPPLSPTAPDQAVLQRIDTLLASAKGTVARRCLLRHATRFARNCALSPEDHAALRSIVLPRSGPFDRVKWALYERLG